MKTGMKVLNRVFGGTSACLEGSHPYVHRCHHLEPHSPLCGSPYYQLGPLNIKLSAYMIKTDLDAVLDAMG